MTRLLRWLLETWTGDKYLSTDELLDVYDPISEEARAIRQAINKLGT